MINLSVLTSKFCIFVGIKNRALGNSFSGITYIASFLKIRQLGQKLKWLDTHEHTQCGDVISQMFFIFRKEKRLKCGMMRTIKHYPLAK